MPYFSTQYAARTRTNHDNNDGAAVLRVNDEPIIQACVSPYNKRRINLSVNIPTAAPIVLGISALDAAWLGTQLLQLAAIADDRADDAEQRS